MTTLVVIRLPESRCTRELGYRAVGSDSVQLKNMHDDIVMMFNS